MSRPDLKQVERVIRQPDRRFAPDEIRMWNLEPLVKDGTVVRAELREEYPWDNEIGFVPVYPAPGGGHYCLTQSGRMALSNDDLQLWRPDPCAIARRLHDVFDCRDRMDEIVPGTMWNLGPSGDVIGRTAFRDVYFMARIGSKRDEVVERLPKDAKSYIAIVGWKDEDVLLEAGMAKHVFPLADAVEVDESGEWKVRRERIDLNFAPENRGGTRSTHPSREEKIRRVTDFFFNLCFIHRTDYDKLCEARKKYKRDGSICKELDLTPTDVSRIIGSNNTGKFKPDPCALFWRRTFLDDDAFLEFSEWVNQNVLQKQKLGPGLLKEEIVKYAAQKLARGAKRNSR